MQQLRDQLLFERYGGKAVAEDEPDLRANADADEMQDVQTAQLGELVSSTGSMDSYVVEVVVEARRLLGIGEHWVKLGRQDKQG
ncbi:MAG: hypothetical protein IPJ18_00715 [Betaproteobacteria bacterium]|nr:hypothetical protein [Betaproteobacteria bacterium]